MADAAMLQSTLREADRAACFTIHPREWEKNPYGYGLLPVDSECDHLSATNREPSPGVESPSG